MNNVNDYPRQQEYNKRIDIVLIIGMITLTVGSSNAAGSNNDFPVIHYSDCNGNICSKMEDIGKFGPFEKNEVQQLSLAQFDSDKDKIQIQATGSDAVNY